MTLSAASGSAPVVLFVNGAAGDVSTRFTRRAQDAGEVSRIGAALATAAVQALHNASPLTGTDSIRAGDRSDCHAVRGDPLERGVAAASARERRRGCTPLVDGRTPGR